MNGRCSCVLRRSISRTRLSNHRILRRFLLGIGSRIFQLISIPRSAPLPDHRHEVVLTITIRANVEEEYLGFLVEVQQTGIFFVKNADPAQLSQVVGISCPTALFPYARESLDNLVVKGGFPPIQLAQVNFEALYVQAMQERQQQQNAAPMSTTH